MGAGIPVRLSSQLATRARTAAATQERSLTEQVEHWARLGQAVEDAILAGTVQRLKARSHDPDLDARLLHAKSAAGRQEALRLITRRNAVRYGTGSDGAVHGVRRERSKARR